MIGAGNFYIGLPRKSLCRDKKPPNVIHLLSFTKEYNFTFFPFALIVDNIFLFHFQQLELSMDKIWESIRPKLFQTNMNSEQWTHYKLKSMRVFSGTKENPYMQDSFFFHTIVGVGMNRDRIGWALGRSNKVGQMVDMVYVSNIFPPRSFSAQTKQGG